MLAALVAVGQLRQRNDVFYWTELSATSQVRHDGGAL